MTFLISLLVSLAAALLKVFIQQRQATMAIEDRVLLRVQLNQLESVKDALEFKIRAARDPALRTLRVRDPSARLDVSRSDPSVDGGADPGAVLDRARDAAPSGEPTLHDRPGG